MSQSIIGSVLYQQAVRFFLAGGVNTLLTLAVYQLLLFWLSYPVAYSLSFALGIVFTGFVYTRFVFSVPPTKQKFVINAVYYLISYAASLWLLDMMVQWFGVNERLAIIFTMACIIPVNFFALRLLLKL